MYMDKRPRFTITDSFIYSCRAFVNKDIDNAFLWAMKVLEKTDSIHSHLTENESAYITEVLKRKKRKDNRKNN